MRRFVPLFVAALIASPVGLAIAGKASPKTSHAAPVALEGYCPVAYVAMGKAVKGDPKIWSVDHGHRYEFVNADAKKMFDADPSKYAIAYEGWCATAVSMGKKVASNPTLFTVHEGRTYLFSSEDAKKMFDGKPGVVISKADQEWKTLAKAKK